MDSHSATHYDAFHTGTFAVSAWEQEPYTVSGSNSDLAEVQSTKDYSGDIEGVSYGRLLMAGNTVGAGYVATEVFVGAIGERTGSFVFQHWALAEGVSTASSGHIIPGSGTGELADLGGRITLWQDGEGVHRIRLESN